MPGQAPMERAAPQAPEQVATEPPSLGQALNTNIHPVRRQPARRAKPKRAEETAGAPDVPPARSCIQI